jgi:hypothetical protein
LGQYGHGDAIGGDMVHDDDEDMFPGTEADHPAAKQQVCRKIEGKARLGGEAGGEFSAALGRLQTGEVFAHQQRLRRGRRRQQAAEGGALYGLDDGAQGGMARAAASQRPARSASQPP